MTGPGASPDDMPNLPWPRRGTSPAEDGALDALLGRAALPPGAAENLAPVAELLTALTAPASSVELATERTALAAFRETFRASPAPLLRRWRPRMLTSLLTAKMAAAAFAAVSLGGVATAAYTGSLPDSAQDFAHDTIGAPPAHAHGSPGNSKVHPSPSHTPVGPDATGSAAYGLCNAWAHAKQNGQAAEHSVAFRNLTAAAGGADQVEAYCATVAQPGTTPTGTPSAHPTHPTGKPTSMPSQANTDHPTGKPTSMPSQANTDHPTGPPASPGGGNRP